jgi:hypothetical protein
LPVGPLSSEPAAKPGDQTARAVASLKRLLWPRIVRLARSGRNVLTIEKIVDEFENTLKRDPRRWNRFLQADEEEARIRLVVFLSWRLAAELRQHRRPRWPGGPFERNYEVGTPQAKWRREIKVYYKTRLVAAHFPADGISELVETLVQGKPWQSQSVVKLARRAAAQVCLRLTRLRITERTVRDYELTVRRLEKLAGRLDSPNITRRLEAIFDAHLADRRRRSSKAASQYLALMAMGRAEPVTISDPEDPQWLPRVVFDFIP